MADFVDYTNVTELEKFTAKIDNLIASDKLKDEKNSVSVKISFRGVEFELSLVEAKEDPVLKGIPHFRFNENQLQKCFDIGRYWLLECVEKGRVLSESTGRLLLGALIQSKCSQSLAVFVRIGEVDVSEKFIGFHRLPGESEYFETFPDSGSGKKSFEASSEKLSDFKGISSAQVTLQWLPNNLRVNYPGFTGYFDSWHPIEQIKIRCIWPKIKPADLQKDEQDKIKFKRQDLLRAPIWLVSFEEAEDRLPLRNTMLRSIQSGHLRELLFTPMGRSPLISISGAKDESKPSSITSLRSLFDAMAQIYRREAERIESDLTIRYSFIPKRVMETMRWERINESFSQLWRRFIRFIEESWNNLQGIDTNITTDEGVEVDISGDIEKSLHLINWCIRRELEWEAALNEHAILRKLYKIPKRHLYKAKLADETVDDKIEDLSRKLETNLSELERFVSKSDEAVDEEIIIDPVGDEEFEDCLNEDQSDSRKVLDHGYDLNGRVIYEPITLNCEPPPGKLLTRGLLNNPLAGDVIAMNQLKEDIRSFKAWNPEICGIECFVDSTSGTIYYEKEEEDQNGDDDDIEPGRESFDLGFIGFLLWHSPNDIEATADSKRLKVSLRMRDLHGQWLEMWRDSARQASDQSSTVLGPQVSFNHRGLLGQVINDLWLKTELSQLVESATPFLTEKAAQLLSPEAVIILKSKINRNNTDNNNVNNTDNNNVNNTNNSSTYPLDEINKALDGFEREMTRNLTLSALCSNIFSSDQVSGAAVLVSDEDQREFLLNPQHRFKTISREVIGEGDKVGWEYCESLSGYEGIRIKLAY